MSELLWISVEDHLPDTSKTGKILVTSNLFSRGHFGTLSHVWLAGGVYGGSGARVAVGEDGSLIHDISHWAEIPLISRPDEPTDTCEKALEACSAALAEVEPYYREEMKDAQAQYNGAYDEGYSDAEQGITESNLRHVLDVLAGPEVQIIVFATYEGHGIGRVLSSDRRIEYIGMSDSVFQRITDRLYTEHAKELPEKFKVSFVDLPSGEMRIAERVQPPVFGWLGVLVIPAQVRTILLKLSPVSIEAL